MRDIKRIDRILKLISNKWKEHPDYRFGQLLINLGILTDDLRMWTLEDGDLENWLKKEDNK